MSKKTALIFAADVVAAEDRPCSGGGIRALQLKTILERAGFEVVVSSPVSSFIANQSQLPEPLLRFSYSSRSQQSIYQEIQPDLVVFASAWTSVSGVWWPQCPTIVDCCGPVFLESLLVQQASPEAAQGLFQRKIDVLGGADFLVLGSRRQQYYLRSALTLAGFNPQLNPNSFSCVLPMGVNNDWSPKEVAKANELSWVYAGGLYPWQNPFNSIDALLNVLDAEQTGQFYWLGGSHAINKVDKSLQQKITTRLKQSSRASLLPYMPLKQLHDFLADKVFSFEIMEQNFERDLALTTRTPHYMGLGLIPLVSDFMEINEYHGFTACAHSFPSDSTSALESHTKNVIQRFKSEPEATLAEIQQQRQNCQVWINDNFSWQKQGQKLIEYCAQLRTREGKQTLASKPPQLPLTKGEKWLVNLTRRPTFERLRRLTRPLFHDD